MKAILKLESKDMNKVVLSVISFCILAFSNFSRASEIRYVVEDQKQHYTLVQSDNRFVFEGQAIRVERRILPCNRRLIQEWWNDFEWTKSTGEGEVKTKGRRSPSDTSSLIAVSSNGRTQYFGRASQAGEFFKDVPSQMLAFATQEASACR